MFIFHPHSKCNTFGLIIVLIGLYEPQTMDFVYQKFLFTFHCLQFDHLVNHKFFAIFVS